MSDQAMILVVEDKSAEREALARMLRVKRFEVIEAAGAMEALEHVDDRPDVVLSDLRLGRESGLDLLRQWKAQRPETPFVLLTAYGEVGSAVQAMKFGAEDYLAKPVDPDELLVLTQRCVKQHRDSIVRGELETSIKREDGFDSIIGSSEPICETIRQARRAALADSTVLVTGESGTGKELLAEAIHQHSCRRDGPFVPVNMAAVPENLVESELFGHVKGSFTGAADSREGRFQAAHGGTLFIDEIGDFAPASQAKLLRVLESSIVTQVGSNDGREVDVRVVAATSRDLSELVDVGEFRGDLFYRLNVIQLRLPPLRERRDDIAMLVKHFLRLKANLVDRPAPSVSNDLMEFFVTHDWPGNVRQLANCLESMVVLCERDELTVSDVPHDVLEKRSDVSEDIVVPPGTSLDELERAAIEQTLDECGGNRKQTAESLGISTRTLQRKLNDER